VQPLLRKREHSECRPDRSAQQVINSHPTGAQFRRKNVTHAWRTNLSQTRRPKKDGLVVENKWQSKARGKGGAFWCGIKKKGGKHGWEKPGQHSNQSRIQLLPSSKSRNETACQRRLLFQTKSLNRVREQKGGCHDKHKRGKKHIVGRPSSLELKKKGKRIRKGSWKVGDEKTKTDLM